MRIGWINRLVMAGILAVSLGGEAKAQVVFSNLSVTTTGGVFANTNDWAAQKFTWNNTLPVIRVDISMQYFATDTPSFAPVVEIWSDSGGGSPVPFASLLTLNPVGGLSQGFNVINSFSDSSNSLQTGTNYWVVLKSNVAPAGGGDNIFWKYTSNSNGTGTGFSTDNALYASGNWSPDPSNPFQMRVEGVQAVPEPSSFVLAGLGLGAMGLIRRRMKKKQAEVETPAV